LTCNPLAFKKKMMRDSSYQDWVYEEEIEPAVMDTWKYDPIVLGLNERKPVTKEKTTNGGKNAKK